jgi:DNA excision repair protein ERCC-5
MLVVCHFVLQAEAQCAWLNEAGLVDGVVTDDNDVFLFGGRHVYRNIFADKK